MWWLHRVNRKTKPDVIVREAFEEDKDKRIPKLECLTKPLAYWVKLYQDSRSAAEALPAVPRDHPDYDWIYRQISNAYSNRVVAQWGMIAKGVEAVPFALKMLKSSDPDEREDGAGVLSGVGEQPGVVEQLLTALSEEREAQAADSIVSALGAMKDKRAIPALAAIVLNQSSDRDIRWGAIEAIGKLARRNFARRDDPVAACIQWLEQHGYR